ncbi:MAG: protocatechuate 3,4-dioxygenase [Alphaproteobacteria bacterium]|jgi:protocatechuate 3,4-dioxygenase beta subunit|nr:protocatechuate 3,4-dioxygenase [Alphaproteobacteria bacterium]MDP6515512.1 protocatechuate 3,4-dioxygenase [Alphaproteobacteria bacterium]
MAQSANSALSRRRLIAGAGALGTMLAAGRGARAACGLTPRQGEGPFFPVEIPAEHDGDLTIVGNGRGRAQGGYIEISGQILNPGCQPVPGVVMEIWQANSQGRYDHPGDAGNPRPLDPDFQGYARLALTGDGRYRYRTVKPGSYPVFDGWVRPPHIHIKVHTPAGLALTTQMYFPGESLNERDRLFGALSESDRARALVKFGSMGANGVLAGAFDITLDDGSIGA